MNDIDECNEALGELANNVSSQTCEAFEKFCDNLREFAEYLSETFFSSELWLYTQSWLDACIKNPKSLHYMRRCKKCRIRKSMRTISLKRLLKFTKNGGNDRE